MDFQGKTAIVTGAGSGIGRATALQLASLGASVAVCYSKNATGAQKVVAQVEAAGGKALALKVDVAVQDEVLAMVDAVVKAWGRVDVLVNNAAYDKILPFVETSKEFWDKEITINLYGMLYCTHAVLPHMIAQKSGSIVFVGSDAGRSGSTGQAVYSACKGGMIGFSKALAREAIRHGIRSNCVCAGLTDTPMLNNIKEETPKVIEAIIKTVPMRRLGLPEEIAEVIVFMASDASSFITGQTLSVNGGLNML